MILHLVSLAKKSKFYKTCSKCAPWHWWHTWSHQAKLSITLTHSSLVMAWICWVIATLSSAIVCGLFWYTWSFKKPQRQNSGGFKSGECGDHSGMRHLLISQPAKRRSSHSIVMLDVWGVAPSCWDHCSSWCMPRWAQWPPEHVENHNVMLFIDRHCLSNIILKPKWSDYAMFQYGNPRSALYSMQWSLKDFIWCLGFPEHRVLAVDMAW